MRPGLVSPRARKQENRGPDRAHSLSSSSLVFLVCAVEEMRKTSTPQLWRPTVYPITPIKPSGPGSLRLNSHGYWQSPPIKGSRLAPGRLVLACPGPTMNACPSFYKATGQVPLLRPDTTSRLLERGTDNTSSMAHVHFASVPNCPAPLSLTGHRRLVSAQAGPWLGYHPSPYPSSGKLLHILHYSAQRPPSPGSSP